MESNCCGASVDTDILICGDCKEHCDAIDVERYNELRDELWSYQDLCYGDDSNDQFDAIHDDLMDQISGFEPEDDLDDVEKMLEEIEAFYKATKLVENNNINFIYA